MKAVDLDLSSRAAREYYARVKKTFKWRNVPGRNYLEYLLLRGASALVNVLPLETASGIAAGFGDLIFVFFRQRRRLALANLEKAFSGAENAQRRNRLARESFRNVAISLMEFFRMPSMLREAKDRIIFEGTEVLDGAFARGKGIIFVISHLGSWEYLAFLPYLRESYPCSVVVRETRNPYVFPWIQRLREQTRLFPIPKKGAAKEILRQLKENHLVAILIDQWAGIEGIWLDFFGEPTSTTPIPARLAARTQAAIVPAYCVRSGPGKYKILIRPEVIVDTTEDDFERKTTLKLNQLLEEEIRNFPEQWTWGHDRWKGIDRFRRK